MRDDAVGVPSHLPAQSAINRTNTMLSWPPPLLPLAVLGNLISTGMCGNLNCKPNPVTS